MLNKLQTIICNPNKAIDWVIRHLLFFLPDKPFISLRFKTFNGFWINWDNPKTFTEKIQWLKVYGYKSEYTKMVDKYAVKEYVSSIIGQQYIIPTIGVWNNANEIDWESLPDQFVLKTTHGGGSYGVVVCSDKTELDKVSAIEKLNKSMNINAGYDFREKPYLNVERKIIAEQFLSNSESVDLTDYKFFCFNGEPLYCQVIRDRHSKDTIDFYDMNWVHQPFVGLNPEAKNGLYPVARPAKLDKMIEICRKLSKDIPFVRIDLYNVQNNIYFGEITFYPASGLGEFSPKEWNEKLGDLINLKTVCVE